MIELLKTHTVNGIDVDAVHDVVAAVNDDPAKALVGFAVSTRWTGQTGSRSTATAITLGGETIERDFEIVADEPHELLGANGAPNPQELLMAAVNACMTVGYAAGAALRGITLDKLEIETRGTLDLRGFLGIDPDVTPGYEELDYVVRIAGNGSQEQFEEIHRTVMATSPNYSNMARPIRMNGSLVVG